MELWGIDIPRLYMAKGYPLNPLILPKTLAERVVVLRYLGPFRSLQITSSSFER